MNAQLKSCGGEHQFCRHISVFIKTFPFAINEAYYGNVVSEKLFLTTRGIPGAS
ncbi:hypothetical protein AAF285_003825 [Salmonella enterica]